MQELEALLTVYLMRNWDRMELVKDANELDIRVDSVIAAAAPITTESPPLNYSSSLDKEAQEQSRDSSTGVTADRCLSVL